MRTVYFFALIISIIGTLTTWAQYKRINIAMGIQDLDFVIFTNVVTGTLTTAFFLLPTLSIYTRLTPKKIEATVYALLTSSFNLSSEVFSNFLGAIITQWVGVDEKNLDKAHILMEIQTVTILLCLPALYLVPTRAQVDERIAKLNEVEENISKSYQSAKDPAEKR